MADEDQNVDAEKQEALFIDIFAILDQKRRGYISRVELAHLLDAMQADLSINFSVPEALAPTENMKDSRVSQLDLKHLLTSFTAVDLEDVKWFAESVVKVEAELREVWRKAVQRWRQRVQCLYNRNLHRYLLKSQPDRVSRWLLLRTSMDEVGKDDSSIGLLGLGISQQEVEVLFTDETADDIHRCSDKIEPFLTALELRGQMYDVCVEGDISQRFPNEMDNKLMDLLARLGELAEKCRELACLLIHEDTLTLCTRIIRSGAFSQAIVTETSKLIMFLLNYRVHENARDYEKLCKQKLAEFLEYDYDIQYLDPVSQREYLNRPPPDNGRQLLKPLVDGEVPQETMTIAEWVGSLLTLRTDFDRGEMLDVLIKYDEKRLLFEADGGERQSEDAPISVSLFSFGRTVVYLISRLDVSSHHSLHEHRTPMRTHLWKFLLNVLSSAGERGRQLFRKGEGMRVVCNVIRGCAWGIEREEVTPDEEQDREEEEDLYIPAHVVWGLRDPYHSWPYVDYIEGDRSEHRYYSMDFLDDKFYGSKDRMLASAFLEYMSSDAMWGEAALIEEMIQYPNALQVLCRVRPPGCFMIRLLLSSPGFPDYLFQISKKVAQAYVERSLSLMCSPDATCHSLFPVCYYTEHADKKAAMETFQDQLVSVETVNIQMRILGHAYHSLQACLQEERSMREGEGTHTEKPLGSEQELDETTELEEEITQCCKLLASRVPLDMERLGDMAVAMYMQVKDFTRKALLAVNQLPPVNADERQKARGLEVAKTVPPRPMYFGHYQQLIYNQSNPTQPSSRSMVYEYQARLKCLQGAADILFTGENRYLSESSLFPYEFLVVLRIVQLVRLRESSVPPFIVELQDSLEQITGHRSSFIFADSREDIEFAGAEYPWRTGLAQLNTFRVSQVPLRRSELRQYPRHNPLAIVDGLEVILSEYAGLNMWEEEMDDSAHNSTRVKDVQSLESRAVKRSVLLALVFNHLCYFHPKMVSLEDSPTGLANRLGLSMEVLSSLKDQLRQEPFASLQTNSDFRSLDVPEGTSLNVFQGTTGSVTALQLQAGDSKVAFVCMMGIWMLWANCTKDNSQVLTECSFVNKYFAFDWAG